jgi:hypothetical protein
MGSIRAYGLATWSCFREAQGANGHLRLQEVVDLAHKVGGLDHGFRCPQTHTQLHTLLIRCFSAWEEGRYTSNIDWLTNLNNRSLDREGVETRS